MHVAIMGAGLSGLACAITLEKNGITPVIFEKRSQVGDRFVNGEILLSVLSKPIDDAIRFLAQQYQIYLRPVSNIAKLKIFSANEQATIEGNLGFVTLRGREQDAFEKQLARQVKANINFNSKLTYEQLLQDYTHVVLATGDAEYALKVHNYQQDLTVTLKGATVTGHFDRYTVAAWLDYSLAPQGYGYLIPLSEQEANIVIGYPDYPQNREQDLEALWAAFWQRVCQDLQQELKLTDRFEVTRYIIGKCKYPRIGNTFFTGNCFGAINPFLGFGQLEAILSGIYAAEDLCGVSSYERLLRPLQKSYQRSLTLRRSLEKLNNAKLDAIVKALKGPVGDKLFNQQKIDFLKLGSYLLRPLL